METFSALLAFCEGNLPVTCGFPSQRPVTRNFDIFFNLRPNKWLRKHRDADDLRRHRAHYGATVMLCYPADLVTIITAEVQLSSTNPK